MGLWAEAGFTTDKLWLCYRASSKGVLAAPVT